MFNSAVGFSDRMICGSGAGGEFLWPKTALQQSVNIWFRFLSLEEEVCPDITTVVILAENGRFVRLKGTA